MNLKCSADYVEELINNTADGGICRLERGEYFIKRRVHISNKKNIVVDGQNSRIITRYDNSDSAAQTDALLIENCSNVVLKNLVIDAQNETNITVVLEEADEENKYVIVKADDFYKINGNEIFMTMCSVDSEGIFDRKFHLYHMHPNYKNLVTYLQGEIVTLITYCGAKTEYLGDNRIKVFMPDYFTTWSKENIGKRICVRHSMYGPAVITVKNSNDTCIKNITMHKTPGMGIVVIGRCNNMTIDGLIMEKEKDSPSLMSCNCDGVHIAGLTGTLTLKNSKFDGMGDDALNIHSIAGTATEIINENTLKCNFCKRTNDGLLSKYWCETGDIIKSYNPDTLMETSLFKVISFNKDILEFLPISGTVNKGDILQNTEFAKKCVFDNVNISHSLGRGCVFQTEVTEVKNSRFSDMPNAGFLVAPAMNCWYEEGPTSELYVHNNEFERCGMYSKGYSICVSTEHGDPNPAICSLHKNIKIQDNIFKTNNKTVIAIAASDNVDVRNNKYISNGYSDEEKRVTFISSKNVTSDK